MVANAEITRPPARQRFHISLAAFFGLSLLLALARGLTLHTFSNPVADAWQRVQAIIDPAAKSGDEPVVPGAGTVIQVRNTAFLFENSDDLKLRPSG